MIHSGKDVKSPPGKAESHGKIVFCMCGMCTSKDAKSLEAMVSLSFVWYVH